MCLCSCVFVRLSVRVCVHACFVVCVCVVGALKEGFLGGRSRSDCRAFEKKGGWLLYIG